MTHPKLSSECGLDLEPSSGFRSRALFHHHAACWIWAGIGKLVPFNCAFVQVSSAKNISNTAVTTLGKSHTNHYSWRGWP